MLTSYRVENNSCLSVLWKEGQGFDDRTMWFDLCNPVLDEVLSLQKFLGIDFPTQEEMHEIEQSSRIYEEDKALFMTVTLVLKVDTDKPEITDVTFILLSKTLVTIRNSESKAFNKYISQLQKLPKDNAGNINMLIGLLEAIVDRSADILEGVELDLNKISSTLFKRAPARRKQETVDTEYSMKKLIVDIGQGCHLNSGMIQSLLNLDLIDSFIQKKLQKETEVSVILSGRLQTLSHDIKSLSTYAAGLNDKFNFLLDATLGFINIEQNAIMRLFSIIAVILMPPTLIASIYGMNLKMPEADWELGYPFAIALMLMSAFFSYIFVKKKGWL